MGGALLDLVAKGGQDVYFISNPQISFFKKVYKRHTNFSIEYNKFFLDTDADFGKMTRIFIPKKGDLIKNIYLHLQLPNLIPNGDAVSYINFIGYNIIDYIEIYMGGTLIDRHTGEWLYIWNELRIIEAKKRAYYEMVGGHQFNSYSSYSGNQGGIYIIPLSFWFGDDISQAIPMVAMQYSEVEIRIKFKEFDKLWVSSDGNAPVGNYKITECQLSTEFVYLDSKERKTFAQSSHEYLIKQVQNSINNNILSNEKIKRFNLNFNHPVLELIFFVQNKNVKVKSNNKGNDWLNFSKTLQTPFKDPIKSAKIILNGQDRTPELTSKELRFYNVIEKHTSIPNNFIYVYSFSLNPEDYQPSGSCNFSRFDNKEIEIEFNDNIENSDFRIYALNYNVLRISMGLCGLAYIN
uniref:Major capsid protein N-terminal domain-containing protein n=1 Tax=viral metagenome TaxID=1070528 RepID=A0A6C0J8V0_9ZZZZ